VAELQKLQSLHHSKFNISFMILAMSDALYLQFHFINDVDAHVLIMR